ncbi:MAG: CidA/LrgA family protein [Lachnospiraceae bacterium]|jgi:holin-like protein|nr:CidA/LrgA family protein [Lachnospiraceae bacterium]MCI8994290.1 CidA/LrgA family protein [Lachnospiraceae bacterium]MCI9132865.1 CidA/LrgA family protein [Lachnospiraceae bacterium]
MKYIKQMTVIAGISFVGEFLSTVLPLPVPGSVYGMLLLFLCLCLKIIRLEQVEETADYLLLVMPVFFVSPGISIIDTYPLVKDSILALVLISFVTALLTMVVTGHVTQFLIRHVGRKSKSGSVTGQDRVKGGEHE